MDVCCETPRLSKPGGTNWARDGRESWPVVSLGSCAGERFPIQPISTVTNLNEATLEISLSKRGTDKLLVEELFINTENGSGATRR